VLWPKVPRGGKGGLDRLIPRCPSLGAFAVMLLSPPPLRPGPMIFLYLFVENAR
jgi:hypothetical protein